MQQIPLETNSLTVSYRIAFSCRALAQKLMHVNNPLVPSAANMRRNAKILILEGIIKKISYERRDYESVVEKYFILVYVPKNYEKKFRQLRAKRIRKFEGKKKTLAKPLLLRASP